jgi:hypothetical protein
MEYRYVKVGCCKWFIISMRIAITCLCFIFGNRYISTFRLWILLEKTRIILLPERYTDSIEKWIWCTDGSMSIVELICEGSGNCATAGTGTGTGVGTTGFRPIPGWFGSWVIIGRSWCWGVCCGNPRKWGGCGGGFMMNFLWEPKPLTTQWPNYPIPDPDAIRQFLRERCGIAVAYLFHEGLDLLLAMNGLRRTTAQHGGLKKLRSCKRKFFKGWELWFYRSITYHTVRDDGQSRQ